MTKKILSAVFGIFLCTVLVGCTQNINTAPLFEDQDIANRVDDANQEQVQQVEAEDPVRCPQGGTFTCGPVTQGIAPDPDNPAPIVCGCAPQCPAGKSLVSSASTEQWPDGTYKGSYGCSSTLPPSAGPGID